MKIPYVVPHEEDRYPLTSIRLVTTYTSGWQRFALTWADEQAPCCDLAVRLWRIAAYARCKDVEFVELSPNSRIVYFDGCSHNGTDPYHAWFPSHGFGTFAVKEWTPDGRPLLLTKTWNHMLSV